jgi:hypothetical protein
MRTLLGESFRVTRKDNQAGAEAQNLIDMAKALNEPAAKESRPPGYKNTLAAYFLPEGSSLLQNQFQVLPGKAFRWCH